MNVRSSRFLSLSVAVCVLMTCFAAASATAKKIDNEPTKGNPPVQQIIRPLAIHEIRFEIHAELAKNNVPSATELAAVINSRACDFSMTSRLLRGLTYESMSHSEVPGPIVETLQEFYVLSSQSELRYFNRSVAGTDVMLIIDFFNQLGFHDVSARYRFAVSPDRRNNVLNFIIHTGKQYTVDTVVVHGIELLPESVQQKLRLVPQPLIKKPFSEPEAQATVNTMLGLLHDSGYAFARLPLIREAVEKDSANRNMVPREPLALLDTVRKVDSITIFIEPQRRYVFGKVGFIDSTHGNPFVVNSLKRNQLEFKTGQWYNLSAIRRSENTIRALGPFDRASIDTSAVGDTINTTVFTSYKKVSELTPSLFVNNTLPDNLNNAGIELVYLNRNLFHDAQVLNTWGRFTLRNADKTIPDWIHNLFNTKVIQLNPSFEAEVGTQYSQPDIMRLGDKRVDGTASLSYSYLAIVDPFTLHTLSAHVSPYFSVLEGAGRFQFDLGLDCQRPVNYQGAFEYSYSQARKRFPGADTTVLKQNLKERLDPYQKLDEFTQGRFDLTSVYLSGTFTLDTRNDIFFPSKGSFLTELLEVAPLPGLLTRYVRAQSSYSAYFGLSDDWVFAWRARVGHVFWWRSDSTVIVPSDRHYYAGGASSIRSFASRGLGDRYSDDRNLPSNVGDLANYVGWATIIELSAEMRFTFPKYVELGSFLSEQVHRIGFTFFCDMGNAFNRLTPSAYGHAQLSDIVDPTRWAVALGAGFRYSTPVGPARLDLGINSYDPSQDPRYKTINNRKFYDALALQISLGHAF